VDDPDLTTAHPTDLEAPTSSPTVPAVAGAAFADFYREFMPSLVGFLVVQGVPLRHAVDVAQETMTHAYRRWAAIQFPKAWTREVASKRWARHLASVEEDLVDDIPDSALLRTDVDLAAWEQRHDILHGLHQLPPRQRQVLAWTLDDYTPQEIATALRMTPDAVRANLYKARTNIVQYLRDGGDDD
jgi:RNA polymerase sigma factor (sigma-70 family)